MRLVRQIPVCGALARRLRLPRLRLQTKPATWECVGCGKQTSVTAGTIMLHSKAGADRLG
jgi:hypothetical protein